LLKECESDAPRRHFERFAFFADDLGVAAFEGNSETCGQVLYESVFLFRFFAKTVIDVKDHESFRCVLLFSSLCQKECERDRVGSA
jgi:hypothetical protein